MPSIPHILIADDHAIMRDLLATLVARLYPTCLITTATTGAEALAVYAERGADLLITDHAMPGMTGLALIQTLRAQQATLPILLVSMDVSIAEVALTAGASRFLAKPFVLAEFLQTVRELLPPSIS